MSEQVRCDRRGPAAPRPPAPRPARRRLPALALLAACTGCAGARAQPKPAQPPAKVEMRKVEVKAAPVVRLAPARPAWNDEQFENWVFNQFGNSSGARQRLDALLALQIHDIDEACRLTDAQKKKLQLTGWGDIKRLFDGVERAKQRFRELGHDVNRLQDVMPDVSPLQSSLQAGLFQDDSLLSKSLRHTLTPEQFARYEAVVQERRAFRHRANIELVVTTLEQGVPFRDAQRRALIDLLASTTKPPRKSSQYEYYLIMAQLGRLPEEKLKPLLSDVQWRFVRQRVDQYREALPMLRQRGLVADDDDAPAPPPPAPLLPPARKQ